MPSEFGFEPRSPRYSPFLVFGLVGHKQRRFRPFLAIFGPFLGHIEGLEGNKRLFVTGQSRRTWSVGIVSLRLAVLIGFWDRFGQKRLFGGTKCAVLEGHLPTWRPRPGAPLVIFWLKTWIWQGHHLGYEMARVEPEAVE